MQISESYLSSSDVAFQECHIGVVLAKKVGKTLKAMHMCSS